MTQRVSEQVRAPTGLELPLLKARLLAALLVRPMTRRELTGWVQDNDARDALAALTASRSVRRTREGGAALRETRRNGALSALARDLQLPSER